jgi:uncharacterized protein
MPVYPTIKQSFGILGLTIVAMIVAIPVYLSIPNEELAFLGHYTLSMGGSVWLAMFLRGRFDPEASSLRIDRFQPGLLLWLMIATAGISYGVISPLTSLVPMTDYFKDLFMQFARYKGLPSFISMVIAAPVLEELLFRGIILEGFLKRYSPVKSVLISALLFGVFHLNPWQLITGFFAGIFIGWIYYRTRNLALAIFIHAFNNLMAFISLHYIEDLEATFDMNIVEYYGGIFPFLAITTGALLTMAAALYQLNQRLGYFTEPVKSQEDPEMVSTSQENEV